MAATAASSNLKSLSFRRPDLSTGEVMMRKSIWRSIVMAGIGCGIGVGVANEACAQPRPPSPRQFDQTRRSRPTVSPYTSLINNGDGGGGGVNLNYFNIVRPREQAQRAARRFSNELYDVESSIDSLRQPSGGSQSEPAVNSSGRTPPTGHPTAFGTIGFGAGPAPRR